MLKRMWTIIGLLTTSLTLPLSAFEQGSYLLFDIREDADAKTTAGRIAVISSVFEAKTGKSQVQMAKQGKKSEFETEITSFQTGDGDSVSTGIEILDVEKDSSKSGSAFNEKAPASGGFFFSY